MTHLPALQRLARVHSLSPDLEIPDAVAPRLALHVTFEPGHRALLEWGLRYGSVGGGVLVPLDSDEPDPMRDRSAERALVEALLGVDAVAAFTPLWRVVARAKRLTRKSGCTGSRPWPSPTSSRRSRRCPTSR